MSSSNDTSWMPTGRHKFNIGSSLGTMLKARKGAQSKRNNNLPVRDFYSFRYNFKPNNVDTSKTGSIEVTKKTDTTTVVVEHPSTQPGDAYTFSGTENSAKELDCLLIYDEELGSFTLEKIDSFVVLQHGKKIPSTLPVSQPSPSITPSPKEPPPAPSPPPAEPDNDDLGADFDAELALLEEVTPSAQPPPPPPTLDLEIFEDPVSLPPPPPSQKKKKIALPGKKRSAAPAPVPAPTASAPAPIPPVTLSSGLLEEEDLEFGRPVAPPSKDPPAKKRRLSDEGLALPGSSMSSGFVQPLPAYQPQPKSLAAMADEEEDDEDEWDEVPVQPESTQDDNGLFGEGEEINLDDFDNEMEQVLDDPEDEAHAPSQDDPRPGGGPILTMNDFAPNEDDEDDFSSSDDSDEE